MRYIIVAASLGLFVLSLPFWIARGSLVAIRVATNCTLTIVDYIADWLGEMSSELVMYERAMTALELQEERDDDNDDGK